MSVNSRNPFPRKIRGIRDSIPQGYILGRLGTGNGNVELIPITDFLVHPLVTNKIVTVTSPIAGDVTGTLSASKVVAIQGENVSSNAPTDGQVLTWVAANNDWEPKTPKVTTDWGTFVIVDSTHYYVANVVSLADPELVYSGGVPVFTLNPGFTP